MDTVCVLRLESERALRNCEIKSSPIYMDPDLSPDPVIELFDELILAGNSNLNTPLNLFSANSSCILQMKYVKRINAIMAKPFSLREFSYRLSTVNKTN